ncbi:MAG: hypothetical protein GXP55_01705 [Deltaproteobacteria bacterium]|nr:hypothetical protein [Deltaproteobacteria bacterium]
MPRFGERPAVEARAPRQVRFHAPVGVPCVWIDARPSVDVARQFARRVQAARRVHLIDTSLPELDTRAALGERVVELLEHREPRPWLLLGPHAGAFFAPSLVVQIGPSPLFALDPATRLIRLSQARHEVADTLARGLTISRPGARAT